MSKMIVYICDGDDVDEDHRASETPKDTDHWKDRIAKLYKIPTSIRSDNIV